MDSYSYSLTDESSIYDEEIKLIVIGDSSVGKTNLIVRYNGGEFDRNSPTTNTASFISKTKEYNNKVYRINIWDTAGQEKYRSLAKIFMKGSNIALLVYAINDKNSFDNLDFWYEKVREVSDDIIIGIAGNKIDLFEEEKISENEAREKAKKYNAKIKFTSALNEETGLDEIIEDLVKECIFKRSGNNSINSSIVKNKSLNINEIDFSSKKTLTKNKKSTSCC